MLSAQGPAENPGTLVYGAVGATDRVQHVGSARKRKCSRHRRIEPYSWLGLGAATLGLGAALACGTGISYADTEGAHVHSGTSTSESAQAEPARSAKAVGGAGRTRPSAAVSNARSSSADTGRPTAGQVVANPASATAAEPAVTGQVVAGFPRALVNKVTDPSTRRRGTPSTPGPSPLADAVAFAARDLRKLAAVQTVRRPRPVAAAAAPVVPGGAVAAVMSMNQAAVGANSIITDVVGSIERVIQAVVSSVSTAVTFVVGVTGAIVHDVVHLVVVVVRKVVAAISNLAMGTPPA